MKKVNPVQGLLYYTFYSASSNLVMMLTILLGLGCFALTGNTVGVDALITTGIIIFSSTFMMSTSKESYSKWNKFQLTLPVKRSDIVASKYLAHFILLFTGIIITVIFIFICMTLHKNIFNGIEGKVFGLTSMSVTASLLGCSLFYPLVYTVGENREESLVYICLMAGFAVSVTLWKFIKVPNFSDYSNAALCIVISMILFIASYMTTVKIYEIKDT